MTKKIKSSTKKVPAGSFLVETSDHQSFLLPKELFDNSNLQLFVSLLTLLAIGIQVILFVRIFNLMQSSMF